MKTKKFLSFMLAISMAVSMMAMLGLTANAGTATKNECYLDLDTSTTDILEKKTIDQNYNLTVTDGDKAGVTKVKLEWKTTDITVTRADAKKWDTAELKWVDDDENDDLNVTAGGAEFTLTNYSDVKVDATVTFATAEYETGKKFTAPTLAYNEGTNTAGKDDGKITLDTANGNNTYSKTNVPTGKISVTVTPVDSDFAKLAATEKATYGTYTVTIGKYTETVSCSHEKTASVYADANDTGTHIYADQDTNYDSALGAWCSVPCFCSLNETTGKYVCSTSNGHTSKETAFEDVNAEGWYYFNGTKFVRCDNGELHPNDEGFPTANSAD